MKQPGKVVFLAVVLALAFCQLPEAKSSPSTRINSYFSPKGKTQAAIIRVIDQAKREIRISMYTFTEKDLADALIAAKKRGVDVKVILDKSMFTAKYTQAHYLHESGVPVMFDTAHRLMHNKYVCIDGKTLITGSYNWTASAEKVNAENTLVIRNNRYLVQKYEKRFDELAATAVTYEDKQGGKR